MAIKFITPLVWPMGKARRQTHDTGRFEVGAVKAIDSLVEELFKFGGDAVITADWDIGNRTGLPLASQRKGQDPAVCITITRKGKSYTLPCDRYDEHWKNCRALALCIESLRTLERHDSAFMETALSGFAALPQNAGDSVGKRDWWDVLGCARTMNLDAIKSVWQLRVKQYHPDNAATGDSAKFREVQQAWEEAQKEKGASRG